MAKAFGDELRRRILQCCEEGQQTQEEIAQRFKVSLRYVGKLVAHKRKTGQAERIPHRPGRKPKFTPPIRERLRSWLKSQPDLTPPLTGIHLQIPPEFDEVIARARSHIASSRSAFSGEREIHSLAGL